MSGNSIEDARRYYVRVRQSFFGLGAQRKNKGWHMAKTQLNCNAGESISKRFEKWQESEKCEEYEDKTYEIEDRANELLNFFIERT
jgi:hypothetical protein